MSVKSFRGQTSTPLLQCKEQEHTDVLAPVLVAIPGVSGSEFKGLEICGPLSRNQRGCRRCSHMTSVNTLLPCISGAAKALNPEQHVNVTGNLEDPNARHPISVGSRWLSVISRHEAPMLVLASGICR